jgi:DNA invertase Pin-like site-specific DNA recombinase
MQATSQREKGERTELVGYLRTSTQDQLLGIDAQRERVELIARHRRCHVARWFTEHESGGDNTRPELDKAMRHARRIRAIVCVAKLDRLARDQSFLMRLYDGKVPIIFGDLPELSFSAADRMMVQMVASFAEFELNRMKERMREWHRQRKARGLPSGVPENLTQDGRLRGTMNAALKRTADAIEEMSDIAEIAAVKITEGWTLAQIADHLNAEGYPTRRGKSWHPIQVKRVLDRIKAVS